VIEKYKGWFAQQKLDVSELKGKVLGCWCKPLPCHGDFLAELANQNQNGKRLPGTVWGVPSDGSNWGRVQGNNTERRAQHPNQLPEVYLERLIRAYTNPGDRILDPFGGSGTTAVVAKALGRRCDTIEISEGSCLSILERLKAGAVRVRNEG
jgi:DNA modification methylase